MRILDRAVQLAVALVFVALVSVISAQVLIRYVVGGSLTWSEEAVRHSFIWLCFLGMVLVTERGTHICIRTLVDLLPHRATRIIELLTDLVTMAFLLVVAWQGVAMTIYTWDLRSPTETTNMGIVYLSVPVSMVLMLVFWIRNTVRRIRGQGAVGPSGAEL